MVGVSTMSMRWFEAVIPGGYSKYSKHSDPAVLERDVRRSRRGLWQDDAAEAPWQYRKHRRR